MFVYTHPRHNNINSYNEIELTTVRTSTKVTHPNIGVQ
jgi:hypothetical protein